jgi:hypothetical protein
MEKKTSKILVALLASMLVLSAVPASFSATITNKHTLTVVTAHEVLGNGSLNVTGSFVYADPVRTKVDSTAQGHLLAINLTGMTITGAQVWLWISETGGAVIEANDTFYAGPFQLTKVFNVTATFQNVTDAYSGETYWLGNGLIIGPITSSKVVPKGSLYYVKITDVSPSSSIPSSDVAVSVNQWWPYESIVVSPTKGPAGTVITVKGVAWDSAKKVNITWATSAVSLTKVVVGPLSPDANGVFSVTFIAEDLEITTADNSTRYVNAYYNVTSASVLDSAAFLECGRRWEQVQDYPVHPGDGEDYADGAVEIFDEIYVAGRYWWASGQVTFYWDWGLSTQVVLKSGVNLTIDGFFNVTVTIPEAAVGWHTISAVDQSFNLNASVLVIPTLILVPNRGPQGTNVTAYGYGFPASSGSAVYNVTLIWDGYDHVRVANGTTDDLGKFVFYFLAPRDYGGSHDVDAFTTDADGDIISWMADDEFYITAVLVITPNQFANNCSLLVIVNGSGFKSGWWDGESATFYEVDLDNQHLDVGGFYHEWYDRDWDWGMTKIEGVWANGTGDLSFGFVGCGFLPGKHVISVYEVANEYEEDWDDFAGPAAWECFEVTAEGDLYAGLLGAINTTVTDVKATLVLVQGDVATIKTDVGLLKISVAALDAKVVALQGNVATVQTTVGIIQGNVTSISGNLATVATNVGTIKADVSAVKADVSGVGSNVGSLTTPLWAAVGLSLIAAIAAIFAVISIRGKLAA